MAFFGKNKHKNNDKDYLLQEDEVGFVVRFDPDEDDENPEFNFFKGEHTAPHALTADEVLEDAGEKPAKATFTIPMKSESGEYSAAARNLMNKMMKAKQVVEQVSQKDEEESPEAAEEAPVIIEEPKAEIIEEPKAEIIEESVEETAEEPVEEPAEEPAEEVAEESEEEVAEEPKEEVAEEIAPTYIEPKEPVVDQQKVDEILAKAQKTAKDKSAGKTNQFGTPDFMEKFKAFLNDEGETAPAETEEKVTYSLASVDEILRSVESKVRQRSLEERLQPNIEIDYGVSPKVAPKKVEEITPEPITVPEPEPEVTIFADNQEPVKIDVVHIDPAEDDLESTRPVPLSYQFSFADEDLPNTDIETALGQTKNENEDEETAEEATIQFDALGDDQSTRTIDIVSSSENIRDERLNAFHFDDEEDFGDLDDIEDEFEEELFPDYSCVDDAPEFRRELNKRCSSLLIRLIPTAILTLLMAVLSLPVFVGADATNSLVFRSVSLVMLGITLLININTIMGIASIFRGQPDMDSPIGLAALITFTYSCVCITQPDTIFLGAAVGLVMFAVNLGKYIMEKRISEDFKKIATSDNKLALKLIDEEQGSADIAKGSGLESALVCGSQRTVNVTGFFKKCYTALPYERMIPAVLIISGALAILAAAVSFLLSSSVVEAASCLAAVLIIFCPPTYYLLNVLPFNSAAKDAANAGALLCGLGGAENISEANSVVFNADQLFPAGTVNLYQMKILSPNPIDQAIVEAAAVASAAKSPLADMFNRMAQGREEIVTDPVDSINLEGNMGISGWIKDRRILIGNRLLMETHGIAIPSVAVDRNILEKGFFPVYVACAGVPCALFVVGYNVDRRIKYELQRLCNTGAVVLINSTDPNITEEMISDYFGIFRESVRLMNANSLNVYKNAVNYQESAPANGLYNGSAEALACLVTASIKVISATKLSMILNFLFIGLGTLLCCYSIFTTGLPAMTAVALLAIHLLNMLVGAIVPLIFKS